MKINGSSDSYRIDRSGTSAAGGAKKTEQTASGADTVQLSGVAAQLAKLAEDQPSAVYDQSRVDAIKDALRRGDFRVDSEVVADRLLKTVQELVTK